MNFYIYFDVTIKLLCVTGRKMLYAHVSRSYCITHPIRYCVIGWVRCNSRSFILTKSPRCCSRPWCWWRASCSVEPRACRPPRRGHAPYSDAYTAWRSTRTSRPPETPAKTPGKPRRMSTTHFRCRCDALVSEKCFVNKYPVNTIR